MRRGHILFRPDDPAAAAAGTAAPPQSDDGAPPPDAKNDEKKDEGGKVEFTPEQQAHIDSLLADRIKRAKVDAAKAAKQEADEAARRAQMDETERLKAEKADAEKRASEADERAKQTLVSAEARVAVMAAGAKPERIGRILKLLDLTDVAVTDGVPDAAAVTKAVNALKGELPELFAATAPSRSGGDMGGEGKRTWTRAQIRELAKDPKAYAEHEEEIDQALAEGRIVE